MSRQAGIYFILFIFTLFIICKIKFIYSDFLHLKTIPREIFQGLQRCQNNNAISNPHRLCSEYNACVVTLPITAAPNMLGGGKLFMFKLLISWRRGVAGRGISSVELDIGKCGVEHGRRAEQSSGGRRGAFQQDLQYCMRVQDGSGIGTLYEIYVVIQNIKNPTKP